MNKQSNIASGETLTVWMITDGKIGDDVQCEAVASRLSPDFKRRIVCPRAPWSWIAPWGPADPRDQSENPTSPISPPYPDIVVASGRRAVPYAVYVKQASNGKTKIVCLKDPRSQRSKFDLIWAPDHDRLSGDNVFSTLTSPHNLERQISTARKNQRGPIWRMPRPILGVIIGGPSGGAHYDAAMASHLAETLNKRATEFASLAITPSRRTPSEFVSALEKSLTHQSHFLWDGDGDNPYIDILANADTLLVTADSHNMLSEAVSTGAGVYVYRPKGNAAKLDRFVAALKTRGAVNEIDGGLIPFDAAQIDATQEIVDEIRRQLSLPSQRSRDH